MSLSAVGLVSAAALVVVLGTRSVGAVADEPLARYREELLDIAFRTASALPMEPHIKDRSRAQAAVVTACLELDQPRRALAYAGGIDNWRRGEAYGRIAEHLARHGDASGAHHCLDLAREAAERAEKEARQDEDAQSWRIERVRSAIASAYLLLGEPELARPFEAGISAEEAGTVEAVRASRLEADDFDEQLAALARVVATGGFERVRSALETYARLFDRFYADEDRRSRVEERIESTSAKLPVQVRIEVTMELAGSALDHGDREKALALVDAAALAERSATWAAEDRVPLLARLATLRYRSGDETRARREAEAALALFDEARDRIVDIYRAGALRPLAEAYQAIGDEETARRVYARAIEEGVANPNSRPRAEDISATCCSMAIAGVEPDDELRARIHAVADALGPPW